VGDGLSCFEVSREEEGGARVRERERERGEEEGDPSGVTKHD